VVSPTSAEVVRGPICPQVASEGGNLAVAPVITIEAFPEGVSTPCAPPREGVITRSSTRCYG